MTDIKLLEQWRDYYWRLHLLCHKRNRRDQSAHNWRAARTLQLAIDVLSKQLTPGVARRSDTDALNEFNQCQYGEYPKDWKLSTMNLA